MVILKNNETNKKVLVYTHEQAETITLAIWQLMDDDSIELLVYEDENHVGTYKNSQYQPNT